jgi:hypothetical protein
MRFGYINIKLFGFTIKKNKQEVKSKKQQATSNKQQATI